MELDIAVALNDRRDGIGDHDQEVTGFLKTYRRTNLF
jgi:hypothetical protein